MQGVSAWNFDVAALKEQAAREGGLEPSLAPIIEGTASDVSAQTGGLGEPGAFHSPSQVSWEEVCWHCRFCCTSAARERTEASLEEMFHVYGDAEWHAHVACILLVCFCLCPKQSRGTSTIAVNTTAAAKLLKLYWTCQPSSYRGPLFLQNIMHKYPIAAEPLANLLVMSACPDARMLRSAVGGAAERAAVPDGKAASGQPGPADAQQLRAQPLSRLHARQGATGRLRRLGSRHRRRAGRQGRRH